MTNCTVCFRQCGIKEGGYGFCGVRTCRNGKIVPENYGKITSLALDPIEKKPLARFYPGSKILSVGSYGCNLRCPFCQNYEISWSEQAATFADRAETVTPAVLVQTAQHYEKQGNIGLAFTYNEPLIGYEFVRDTAKLAKEAGMKTVLVTNGSASLSVLEKLTPWVDAMNIDLKGFTDRYYAKVLGGNRQIVLDFITQSAKVCHAELTTLIIPGENDSEEEMREMTGWIASLTDNAGRRIGPEIPLHISRFFPRFRMTDRGATEVGLVYRLAEVAREQLNYVYTGNC